jgi:hypothetical protein
MPDPKQPRRPKTTQEILAEMENMSKGVGSTAPEEAGEGSAKGHQAGGALKSLLGFFVKVVPDEELEREGARGDGHRHGRHHAYGS